MLPNYLCGLSLSICILWSPGPTLCKVGTESIFLLDLGKNPYNLFKKKYLWLGYSIVYLNSVCKELCEGNL